MTLQLHESRGNIVVPKGISKTSIYLPSEDLKLLKSAAVDSEQKVNRLLLTALQPLLASLREGQEAPPSKPKHSASSEDLPSELLAFWENPETDYDWHLRNAIASRLGLNELKQKK